MLEFEDAVNVTTSQSGILDIGFPVLFTGKSYPSTKTKGLTLGVMFPQWPEHAGEGIFRTTPRSQVCPNLI